MIPTKQTILHDPENGKHGNCLTAVLASLLHMDIEDIPVFADEETWVKDLNTWLRRYGLAYVMMSNAKFLEDHGITGVWHEVSGNTSRFSDVVHACVARDGEIVFDPHPDGTGLSKIDLHGFFIVLEPWNVVSQVRNVAVW